MGRYSLGGSVAMIALNNLVTGYHNRPLGSPLSGSFRPGSMTAVVGANGTGKSTLLRTIAGLLPPVSGRVIRPPRQTLGWMPQHSELDSRFPLSVNEVVAMGCWPERGLMRGLPRAAHARIASALERAGISALSHTPISHLSGGQFQRMLFARLLVQNAPLMLLDEPFRGIDEESRRVVMEIIESLNATGTTFIVVLHDRRMVMKHFNRILTLRHGTHHWDEATFAPLEGVE